MTEVIMASTILGVGLIGVIQAVTFGSENIDTARKQQIATQIVSNEIERLRNSPWTTIAAIPSSATIEIGSAGAVTGDQTSFALCNFTAATGDDNTDLSALASGFTCTVARTRLRPASATATSVTYVKLVYTMKWKSNTGREYTRTTETYLGKNGLHLSYQKS